MKEVIDFLNENRNGFMATVEDGKPRVRPWGFMFEENGRLYFCTSSAKDVYRQMVNTPHVEFSMMNSGNAWIRISGGITFTEDQECKARVLGASEVVKSVYRTADNPLLKVFYIEHGRAVMADFSGQPPKTFTF
jgi:uncharacterized pyridoxamine 5'-phosphate oxidase family protein